MAPSVQRRKVWLTLTAGVPCSNAAKTRNPLKLAGCPKLANRSQPLLGRSSPYGEYVWRKYCCLTSFFPIVGYMPSLRKYSPTSLCDGAQMAIFGDFLRPVFSASRSTFQTYILNSHHGHTMCRSMVDIQSATAEIRRGEELKIKEEKEDMR